MLGTSHIRSPELPPHLPAVETGNLSEVMPLIKRNPRMQRPCHWRRTVIRLPHEHVGRIERAIAAADLRALVVLHAWLQDRRTYQATIAGLREALAPHAASWGTDVDVAARAIRRAALVQVRDGVEPDTLELATEIARCACLALLHRRHA